MSVYFTVEIICRYVYNNIQEDYNKGYKIISGYQYNIIIIVKKSMKCCFINILKPYLFNGYMRYLFENIFFANDLVFSKTLSKIT